MLQFRKVVFACVPHSSGLEWLTTNTQIIGLSYVTRKGDVVSIIFTDVLWRELTGRDVHILRRAKALTKRTVARRIPQDYQHAKMIQVREKMKRDRTVRWLRC